MPNEQRKQTSVSGPASAAGKKRTHSLMAGQRSQVKTRQEEDPPSDESRDPLAAPQQQQQQVVDASAVSALAAAAVGSLLASAGGSLGQTEAETRRGNGSRMSSSGFGSSSTRSIDSF